MIVPEKINELGIIVNPAAGGGRAPGLSLRAEAELRRLGVQCRTERSSSPEELALLIPRFLERGIRRILVIGGDGTLNVVINGVEPAILDGSLRAKLEIGVLPAGTANDFAHALRVPAGIEAAVRLAVHGQARPIDVCRLNSRLFLNASGVGLDAAVAKASRAYAARFGRLAYVVAAAAMVCRLPPWQVRVRWDGGEYAGPMRLITISNGCRTGGCYYMTPHADLSDGRLDLLINHTSSAFGLVRAFPAMLRPGRRDLPESICAKSSWVEVAADVPLPVHADGELIDGTSRTLRYDLLPGALSVVAGQGEHCLGVSH